MAQLAEEHKPSFRAASVNFTLCKLDPRPWANCQPYGSIKFSEYPQSNGEYISTEDNKAARTIIKSILPNFDGEICEIARLNLADSVIAKSWRIGKAFRAIGKLIESGMRDPAHLHEVTFSNIGGSRDKIDPSKPCILTWVDGAHHQDQMYFRGAIVAANAASLLCDPALSILQAGNNKHEVKGIVSLQVAGKAVPMYRIGDVHHADIFGKDLLQKAEGCRFDVVGAMAAADYAYEGRPVYLDGVQLPEAKEPTQHGWSAGLLAALNIA